MVAFTFFGLSFPALACASRASNNYGKGNKWEKRKTQGSATGVSEALWAEEGLCPGVPGVSRAQECLKVRRLQLSAEASPSRGVRRALRGHRVGGDEEILQDHA